MDTKISLLKSINAKQASEISILSDQLGYKSDGTETHNQIEKIIASKDNCIFIAVQNETIVGWIHAFYTIRVETKPFIEIAGLVVHHEYRKQQIGKNLIKAVVVWAQTFYCDQISVRCNEIRSETHQFYMNLGFKLNKKQLVFELKS